MRGKATSVVVCGSALVLACSLLAGCGSADSSGTGWTARPESVGSGTGASPAPEASSPAGAGSGTTGPGTPGSSAPQAPATASAWKTYSDPGKTVSFDLPEDWIAQSVAPSEGSLPGALKIEVKKSDGSFVAALQTGLPPSSAECPEASKRPYTVLSSIPAAVTAAVGDGTIPPRVVFRVIQGYRYFGSYGITNLVGGPDGQACELRNIIRGPAGKGDSSFGDVVALRAFAPDEKVAPAKGFDTLAQAAQYAKDDTGFANVQRMLMSLEIKN